MHHGCRVKDCYRKHYGNGLCQPHYMRERRGMALDDLEAPLHVLFWRKVNKGKARECWTWTGRTTGKGYGYFGKGIEPLAHRFSYILAHGRVPEGKMVRHKCDNPPCVNPAHLFAGTGAEKLGYRPTTRR